MSLVAIQRPRPLTRFAVTHIQGNLVLAQAELLSNSGSRHWLFSGAAIRMAEVMRLNKDFHQKHSPKEQEIRRRTFWACLLFDRALAYFLVKHRTIDLGNVGIPVPDSDVSLVYQEGTRGVTLDDLASYPRPSDLGLSPYLIKTVCLWSSLNDFAAWVGALHPSLRWSRDSFSTHCALGNERSFVAMHFLLRSAACVAHQCYLPHLAMYTQLVDLVDAAGWSYLHREQSLIDVCVSNALQIGEMLSDLMDPEGDNIRGSLQTIWVASSTLIAANTLLWLRYAQDEAYSDEGTQKKAQAYFDLIEKLISSWSDEWDSAKQWLMALNVMHALYKAAYLGELHEHILSPGSNPSTPADNDASDDFRPQPGDGYPSFMNLPNLQACIKFATGDTSVRSIDIQAAWLQLSGGWPYGYTSPAPLTEQAGEVQLDYTTLGRPALGGQ
ncbi:hypothetical protein VUR80DRAFT_421 [Thermomyces stellatus]